MDMRGTYFVLYKLAYSNSEIKKAKEKESELNSFKYFYRK